MSSPTSPPLPGEQPTLQIRRGATFARDEATAARELAEQIWQADAELTLFYCSPHFDLDRLGAALGREFRDTRLIGCTTAGEIAATGYHDGSLTGLSIGRGRLHAVSGQIDITPFHIESGAASVNSLRARLAARGSQSTAANTFGFLLIDGLSMQEELVASCLHQSLHGIQMFGGSAGDGVNFGKTFIYHEGRFQQHIAVLTLVQTSLPFHLFRTQHFSPTTTKLVVTLADPSRRIVHEINGRAAGEEFARAVGLDTAALTPLIFADHPVLVRLGGELFVRSIQKVNADGSLTFFCAIDNGLVLTVARGQDLVENLDQAFRDVRERIGPPQLVLGCDCILRRLEMEQRGLKGLAERLLIDNNVVGFTTYGEQFNAMHVNQTFTGVAIGY